MATTAEIQTSTAAMVAGIAGFTTVALRRIASSEYGIKGMSSARKSDLLAAIHVAAAKREEEAQTSHGRHEREQHEFHGVTAGCPECEAKVAADAKLNEEAEALAAKIDGKNAKAKTARAKRTKATIERMAAKFDGDLDQSDVDADGDKAADAQLAADLAETFAKAEEERLDAEAAEMAAKIKPADVAKRDAKGKVRGTKCQVCQSAKIDRKTQGRDSTMCADCYDYAGWENTHSDDNHEEVGADADCPVCAKVADATPATEVTEIQNPKAARFAADAVAAGWKVASATVAGTVTTVIAAQGVERLEISWDGTQCVNTGTTHKGTDGKVRKVRNASAARKILAA